MQRLYRSTKDSMIGGVCGGIAERFNWDPSLVRIVVVFLGLITAVVPVFVTYVVAWVIIPERPPEQT